MVGTFSIGVLPISRKSGKLFDSRPSAAELQIMETSDQRICNMIRDMTTYFVSMIDPATNRFYLISRPPSGELFHEHCPVRELGVTWDALTLLEFWGKDEMNEKLEGIDKQRLSSAVEETIQCYMNALTSYEDHLILDPNILREPSNIAHSGFLILTIVIALRMSMFDVASVAPLVNKLARGIISMQNPDGSFRVEFGSDDVYKMIEFFPGEAMVGLMELYTASERVPNLINDSLHQSILLSMKRALKFYSNYWTTEEDVGLNFNIWQIQAFSRLFQNDLTCTDASSYTTFLCQDLARSLTWKMLSRGKSFYPNLQTVEIAIGMDAIMEGISTALIVTNDADVPVFCRCACNAVDFLETIQSQVQKDSLVGFGGLGYGGLTVMEQRLDVTGHAVHALIKMVDLKRNMVAKY